MRNDTRPGVRVSIWRGGKVEQMSHILEVERVSPWITCGCWGGDGRLGHWEARWAVQRRLWLGRKSPNI